MAFGQVGQRARQVVFAEAKRHDPLSQPLGAGKATGGRAADLPFQPAFAGGVVVKAQIVGDQRQGRHQIGAKTARAQEAILDPQARKLRRLGSPDQQPAPGSGGSGAAKCPFLRPSMASGWVLITMRALG